VFTALDNNGNGVIDYEEYAVFLSAAMHTEPAAQLGAIFAIFDVDGDGNLTVEEMGRLVRVMASFDPDTTLDLDGLEPELIAEMMHIDFDEDGDGGVSKDEFVKKCADNGMLGDLLAHANMSSRSGLGLKQRGTTKPSVTCGGGGAAAGEAPTESSVYRAPSDVSVSSSASQMHRKLPVRGSVHKKLQRANP
jgi:hypothetical protein